MSINKLIVFAAAFMLASFLGSAPVSAQVTCDPVIDPVNCGDDDSDGIINQDDECPNTDAAALGLNLVIDTCTVPGVVNTLSANGCSLSDVIMECAEGAKNHGKFVSCVAHLTNDLKKAKVISGKQKGKIQSCAARSDIGK